MPDIDPVAAYKTLSQRASAMRAEADAARKQSVAEAKEDDRRFGLRRDELDRERGALARDAELADAQVKTLEEHRQTMVESADQFEADLQSGKDGHGNLWKRNAEEGRAAAEQLAERAAAARADAAATRERLAGVDRKLVDLDNEVRVAGDDNQAARMAIFALDDQAGHVEEAARRYGEAAAAGDNIPERAAKELAAEQAMQSAGATAVDRDAIRRVIPTFPDQTPGLADNPWPPPTPVIGPEETLDPFASDTDAAAAGDTPGTSTDQVAFTDPFGGSADDASAEGTDLTGAAADGNDAAFFDRETAQLAGEGLAAVDGYGLDAAGADAYGADVYGADADTLVAGTNDSTDDAAFGTNDAASATETGGDSDEASAAETGYDEYALATDLSGGYGDDAAANPLATTDATAAYDDYASTTDTADTANYDDYASASADGGYDDGSVA